VEVLVLASGSSGNAVLVRSGETSLLLDVGVSALQIRRRLEAFGVQSEDVSAALLTHEHSDHVRGLEVFLKRHPIPVWATAGTWSGIKARSDRGGELLSGRSITIDHIRVTPVATSHDAREPVALVVEDGRHRMALCTDTGIFTALLAQRLAGCDLLLMEANHDVDMLRNGPYPWYLKQRINSRLGHLSNQQSQEAVDQLRSPDLKGVVGMHLSAENNAPDLVCDSLGGCVGETIPVEAVSRTQMMRVWFDGDGIEIDRRPVPPSGR
jgi:phosphoribosyl 1,2-cyclic phosphodiesterase